MTAGEAVAVVCPCVCIAVPKKTLALTHHHLVVLSARCSYAVDQASVSRWTLETLVNTADSLSGDSPAHLLTPALFNRQQCSRFANTCFIASCTCVQLLAQPARS